MRETFGHVGTAIAAAATAFALTYLLTPLVRALAVNCGWVARPVHDRWGRRVIGRLGGAAMFVSFIAAVLCWVRVDPGMAVLLVGTSLVFLLGLVDDLRRMPPYTKLIAQMLIGCVVVVGGIRLPLIDWIWLSIPLSILWFVFVMNAFNLLDNMDGLAAGVGAIAAAFCALHTGLAGQWMLAVAASIVCGVCLGFLCYNFPPAKIFMGDSGSHLLGFSLAALAVMGNWHRSTQLVSVLAVPMLVLAVPIFDTCFVTLQRLAHRQHPFTGGTDHVSHRLAVLGLTERQTVTALYGASVGLGLLSLISRDLKPLTAVTMWSLVLAVLVLCGCYLARVKVYRLHAASDDPGASSAPSPAPATPIATMLMHKRRLLEILVDFAVVSSAYVCAYFLRFEGTLSAEFQVRIMQSLPLILFIKLACFAGGGLYRGVWRYLSVSDIITIFKAVTLGSILSSMALLYLWRFEGYSRSVLVIDGLLTFLGVGGSRVVERLLDEWVRGAAASGLPTVIIGAGDTGARVLRWLKYETQSRHRVIGFLDDDARKVGDRIYGTPVLGTRELLPRLIEAHRVQHVLVAITDPPGLLLQHVRAVCEPHSVSWRVVTAEVTDALKS
ncbi:MAG: hypothetical protein HY737_01160 [Candidatus Omnitrophica bacterium]|nr:hypothetical protein [Candidatus Omnitrophota bacterium]